MRTIVFCLLIALAGVGAAYAQGWGWGVPEPVQVEGTLQLQNGLVVLSTGTTAYHVPGLHRYIGFVEGLREGARISVSGHVYANRLDMHSFTLEGRVYDLMANVNAQGWGACCGYGPAARGPAWSSGRHHRGRW